MIHLAKKRVPSMNCGKCGQETFMPFRCPYCGNQFCSEHRLPENHQCPNLIQAQAQKQETASATVPNQASYEYKITFGQPRKVNSHVYFSPKELQHLVIGALLVIGVGFSFGFGSIGQPGWLLYFSALAAIMTVSFFIHEIAHKVTAQKRGLWSEFRLTTWGVIITLVTFFLPFKLISPGAVMISGPVTIDDMGKTSIAGPITNIVLSAVFLSAGAAFISSSFYWIFIIGAFLNAWIAVFNLVPFGILDGFKIYSWNKLIWVLVFAAAVALVIPSYILYSQIISG
jgi:Zn-dependent protease